jgi:pimeloyl-ACP methyl ester carboxylesterase
MIRPETTFHPSTDGVQVAVHDFGGKGPLVILCHATGFCGHVWLPMAEALVERFHCVAVDFRAHGVTKLPEGVALDWRGMANDLTAVIDAWSPREPVWAIGHSMGGSAIIMAETARAGLVERAWMYEPILLRRGPVLLGDDAPDIANAARARRATFASRQEARDRYASRPPLSVLDPRALDAYVEHGFEELPDGSVTLRCTPEHEASVFEHHLSGAFELVHELAIPFRIAVGGASPPVPDGGPAVWVAEAAATNPRLETVTYPDLTHFGPLEAPDRLAADAGAYFLG